MTPIQKAAQALSDLWDDATEYGSPEDMARSVFASIDPEELRDVIAGWPIGTGYYGTSVGVDEASQIAHAVIAHLTGEPS